MSSAPGDPGDDGLDDEPDGDEPDDLDDASDATIANLADDLAHEFADVQRRVGPDGVDYLVGAQPFARVQGTVGQFRLRTEIVAAAVRTPGAAESKLGREWVAFDPREFDQYAVDRAQSWFELAHRLAAEAAAPSRRH